MGTMNTYRVTITPNSGRVAKVTTKVKATSEAEAIAKTERWFTTQANTHINRLMAGRRPIVTAVSYSAELA